MRYIYSTILLLFLVKTVCSAQLAELEYQEHRFRIDPFNHIIVVQDFDLVTHHEAILSASALSLQLESFQFDFLDVPDSLSRRNEYLVTDGANIYALFFTELPLIKIESSQNIIDDPKVPAIFYYADSIQILLSNIGIEVRGGASQGYPKKTYDLEFWLDPSGEQTIDVQFGNMRSDDDWVLDGIYNEPMRLRSHFSHQLWLKIHEPAYATLEPDAQAGADVTYAELFLNGHYQGIYNLSEQVDRQLLQLKEFNGNVRGELYKGDSWGPAVSFSGLPDFDNASRNWGGHELKYPQEEVFTDWQNLHNFTDFILNSSDSEFSAIWSKFDYQNFLDYFIFLNVTRATDNTGKNIYIAKYDIDYPYFYVPWDLDGTFGLIWNGLPNPEHTGILTNGFINRVIDLNINGYSEDVRLRWSELRSGPLHIDSLHTQLASVVNQLSENNIYSRESLVFPNYPYNGELYYYIVDWIDLRIEYLDIYFDYELGVETRHAKKPLRLFPNPANSYVYMNESSLRNHTYEIYDLLGKKVASGVLNDNQIDLRGLIGGLYIVQIDSFSAKLWVE